MLQPISSTVNITTEVALPRMGEVLASYGQLAFPDSEMVARSKISGDARGIFRRITAQICSTSKLYMTVVSGMAWVATISASIKHWNSNFVRKYHNRPAEKLSRKQTSSGTKDNVLSCKEITTILTF
jgi:hypothetical protein